MNTFLQDGRHALRILLKAPVFTAAAVATLALAIGVNTAVFSIVNELLLKPLPFEDSDRLVWLFRESKAGKEVGSISYPDYLEYRDRSEPFEQLAAFSLVPVSVGSAAGTEGRMGQAVTGNYFATLGVSASLGRMLSAEDDRKPGGHPVVVLSHRYWRRAQGGRPEAVGETIAIGGKSFTIVGIAPEGFSGAMPVPAPDLWVSMMMLEEVRPAFRGKLPDRNAGFLWVLGRLKPGIQPSQAQAALAVTASQLEQLDPDHYAEEHATIQPTSGIIPMTPETRSTALALSTLLISSVGLVLLVGCANLANLLLSQATSRRRELGIRLALGASRLRVVRQLMTENLLLALLGGAAGLVLAVWTTDVLVSSLPQLPFHLTLGLDFGLDSRILLFTLIVSAISILGFGLLPALASTRTDPSCVLRDEAGARHPRWRSSRVRSALVVGQIALSLLLLVGAGLFARSLLRAQAIDPGFQHESVLAVTLDLGAGEYDDASRVGIQKELLARVRAMPSVESASIDTTPPLTLAFNIGSFWIEGREYSDPEDERVSVATSATSAGNLKTLSIPLLKGRDFDPLEAEQAPKVAIVNEAFADRFWPGQDPLGKRISASGAGGPYLEVIGVARTARYWLIGEEPRPFAYLPLSQGTAAPLWSLLVRTEGDPRAAIRDVRAVIQGIDPDLSPWQTTPLTELISFSLLPARFAAVAFGMFGFLAALLASVGLYGVMSNMVSQRTHEVGVRMALGAQAGDILRLMLRQGLTVTAIGLGAGVLGALACTRVLSSLLYRTSTLDPVTFLGVSLLLAGIAVVACYFPARRAMKTEPVVTLRYE